MRIKTSMLSALILLTITLVFLTGCTQDSRHDAFAQCLTEKGVKMYGTEWCPHCKNQKKEFGASFGYVDYIDCDRFQDKCLAAGVKGYPTWVINGQSYPGEQDLGRLAVLSGCTLQ